MKGYYCYVENRKSIIKENKPENFESLPFYKFLIAPNLTVARLIYETDLKLMKKQKE